MPRQQGFRMRQEFLAGGREAHPGPRPVQEHLADQPFEPVHLHAQRRLRAPDLLRGEADRARPRDEGEAPEQGQIEKSHAIRPIDIQMKQYQFACFRKDC